MPGRGAAHRRLPYLSRSLRGKVENLTALGRAPRPLAGTAQPVRRGQKVAARDRCRGRRPEGTATSAASAAAAADGPNDPLAPRYRPAEPIRNAQWRVEVSSAARPRAAARV